MVSKGQLRWRCRRGVRELDMLLESYLDNCFDTAGHQEKAEFAALLKLENTQLLSCFASAVTTDSENLVILAQKISSRFETYDEGLKNIKDR